MAGNPIPNGYNEIINALFAWGNSGLIPNTKVVKSYYPPVVDPITGIAAAIPATVYSTKNNLKDYKIKHNNTTYVYSIVDETYTPIDQKPNAPYAGSNVEDYNIGANNLNRPIVTTTVVGDTIEVTALNPKTDLAVNTVKYSANYKQAAISSNTQEEYENNIKTIAKPVAAERQTMDINYKIPRITDNLADVKHFFLGTTSSPQSNTGSDQSSVNAIYPSKDFDLFVTQVPCAMPGVLNCYPIVYHENRDLPLPNYTPVVAQTYFVPEAYKNYVKNWPSFNNDINNGTRLYTISVDYELSKLDDTNYNNG